jgi:hypothetical protein
MNEIATTNPARSPIDPSTIPGWGVDADPKNDPTYPYRNRENEDHSGEWARPPVQRADVEILQSIEHKQRPAVVGTPHPPSGLSGAIRRAAFTWSESNLMHWMLLLGADRVNMVEGLLQDLAVGRIPNIPAERGLGSEWEHNKGGLLLKSAGTMAAVAIVATLLKRRHDAKTSTEYP